MSFLQKAANVAHKTTVSGLFGLLCFGMYNLTGQVIEGASSNKSSNSQAGFIKTLRDKAAEEYAKYYDISHREWYDKDDDSYLKKLPKPKDYQDK
mmetsp:Transcript_8176/g.14989  ORF Transcript_8176/g.14989 Transcript_8176/m.14989 type:complete len:95 (+) Transcript_8176:135-419(+)|eukprot:CAMPEP_0197436252 /NCGR_PEP_ID=MMETSP1175-20131217/3719_1 /TAXON_ID=1003142 /ORGANISM="Triceratium dubium, Strain CCMP147" /LENGTH=94 /DNA_ID=CAMNT_0042965493 /DNA_START=138 /DNA_END=422 /DNA_ORIENTATION=+